MNDPVQFIALLSAQAARFTDVEVGQLFVGDTFSELALDDDEKMPRRLSQHVVHVDIDGL